MTVAAGGDIYVVFYDRRSSPTNSMTEVWVAHSSNRGQSFEDFRVSDVAFDHVGIGGAYVGHYIGITATPDYVYPVWNDNRLEGSSRGIYQAYFAPIPLKTVSGHITADTAWKFATLVAGTLTVDSGVTLTIRERTRVIVDSGTAIVINGNLVFEAGSERQLFCSETGEAGSWSGIRVGPGGSVDWGNGCVIRNATTGVTVDPYAQAQTIRGVTVESPTAAGFEILNAENSCRLVEDSVFNVASGYGVYAAYCDPVIDTCFFDNCQYGVYTIGSSGIIRDNVIHGKADTLASAATGIYLLADVEYFGVDTVTVVDSRITGCFDDAHIYVGPNAGCVIDGCELETFITFEHNPTPYGVMAESEAVVRMRSTRITGYASVGFISFNSLSDLGTASDHGNNSIYADSVGPLSVTHECELFEMGMGEFGEQMDAGGPPDPEPACELKAEYNWWGSDPPDPDWFVNVDYTPWLEEDPLGKRAFVRATGGVQATTPDQFTLEQNYPNPFNPATTIQFTLPTASSARVSVYNILGQEVNEVSNTLFEAGANRVIWDGRDRRGHEVASGIYLYRVTTAYSDISRKMVLLR